MKLAKTTRGLVLIASLTLLAAVGCKDKGGTTTPKAGEATEPAGGAPYDAEQSQSGPGWRWEGKRGSCFYLVDKTCFDQKVDACEAAQCGVQACIADSGVPARVSCKP